MRFETRSLLALIVLLAGAGASSAGFDQFHSGERFALPDGETHAGDMYVFAGEVRILGDVDGDLIASSAVVSVSGDVDGDLFAGGGRVEVRGRVADSVRLFAGEAKVSGTIEGDLIVVGGQLTIEPEGRITGNLLVCGGRVQVDGTVEGGMTFVGGEVAIGGVIVGDSSFEADRIQLQTGSEIRGDLDYLSRKELERDEGAVVLGEIRFEPKVEDEESSGGISAGWAFWSWLLLGAIVVGLVLLALLRQSAPAVLERIDREGLLAGVVGFVTFLVFPTAALLAMVPLITIPLVVVAGTLFGTLLYLAKLPVALWIGHRLLRAAGRSAPSPFVALSLGLVLLYLLFRVPYLGSIVWFVSAWVGLGSLILAVRNARAPRQA